MADTDKGNITSNLTADSSNAVNVSKKKPATKLNNTKVNDGISKGKAMTGSPADQININPIQEEELAEINQQQRMKRRLIMRRYEGKIEMARKRALLRRAGSKVITNRARKLAIQKMKTKLSGGRDPSTLSPMEKQRLEDIISKRKAAVRRLAMRLIPQVRKKEAARFMHREQLDLSDLNESHEIMLALFDVAIEINEEEIKSDDKSTTIDAINNRFNSKFFDAENKKKKIKDDKEKDQSLEPKNEAVVSRTNTTKREDGTNSLTDLYKKDTPGETVDTSFALKFKDPQKDKEAVSRSGHPDRKEMDLVRRNDSDADRKNDSAYYRQQSIQKKIVDEAKESPLERMFKNPKYAESEARAQEAKARLKKAGEEYEKIINDEAKAREAAAKQKKVQTNEDLRDWFKDKWVRMDTKGGIKGDCAREPGEGKPKCLPIAKARAMDKEDRAAAVRRKRREDPVADRAGKGGAPVNVKTEAANSINEQYIEEKNAPTNPSLWSKAKSLARQKFDVYPSAYANGWAAKWYKGKGGGWKSISESSDALSQWKNKEPVNYTKHLTKFFGNPDELTENRAVWYDVDGFKRIEILDEYVMHSSPSPHYDYVYCYIDLKVPHDLSNILADSSESILLDHLKGEVGARCASLSANAVTLQYVMDVVEGNVEPSKKEYESRIKAMKKMFEDGKRYQLDWWPDASKDTDPSNTYYEHVDHHSCNHGSDGAAESTNQESTLNELSQNVLRKFTKNVLRKHPDTIHTSKLVGKDVKRRKALDLALDKLNPTSAIRKPKVIATTKEDLEEDEVLATSNLGDIKIVVSKNTIEEQQIQIDDNHGCSLDDEWIEELGLTEHKFIPTGFELYEDWNELEEEAEHMGRKVRLNKPFLTPGGPKKRSVYVKHDQTGNVVKVNFGDPNLTIKRDDPTRKRSYRARHHCHAPGPRHKANYWSCKYWSATPTTKLDKG